MDVAARADGLRPLHLAGAGSFASEVAEWAQDAGFEIAGLIQLLDPSRGETQIDGFPVLALDAVPRDAAVVVAAGGNRSEHWSRLRARGCVGTTVVHPHAHVSATAELGPGCVVAPGAVIGASTVIGEHTLISRGVLVGHHDTIGTFVSLLPGANLASHIVVGDRATVAMGAVVIDHTRIGADAVVAAGAVVVGEVADGWRVQGVPAQRYRG
jgi:sugar O-acyltransferase (sialic acid O-acetyltransferase NeuD family)